MRAIKIEAQIEKDRSLHLHLPDDVAAGPAEVLVLVPDQGQEQNGHTFTEVLDQLAAEPAEVRTKEALDAYLASERDSWE